MHEADPLADRRYIALKAEAIMGLVYFRLGGAASMEVPLISSHGGAISCQESAFPSVTISSRLGEEKRSITTSTVQRNLNFAHKP